MKKSAPAVCMEHIQCNQNLLLNADFDAKFLASKQQNAKTFGVSILVCCYPILDFMYLAKYLGN